MKVIGLLLALAAVPALARQSPNQPQVQTSQQAQQAQQARQQAEAYLRREESAATGSQTQRTERANQDAAVADEAAGHSDAARPARSTSPDAGANGVRPAGTAPPQSYGPVLNPRRQQGRDPARKDPAEVRDETDSLTREAPPQSQPKKPPKQAERRHPAWQGEGPMAPRSLNGPDAAAIGTGMVPVPPPAQAPQPVVPSTQPLNSCIGGACRDAAGSSYNLGPTGVGVSSNGRPCTRSGATVQCF